MTNKMGGESERLLTLGAVWEIPESRLDDFFSSLESVEDLRLIYKKIAVYRLYITAFPPSGVN